MLTPFIVLCGYMHPDGDDLNYACKSLSGTLLENWKADYFHWNGRYASNFLVLQNPISFGDLMLYRLAPFVLICLTVLSIRWTIQSFFTQFAPLKTWLISILTTVMYLSTMPIISEGIYWYTGAFIYHASCLLCLIYGTWLGRFLTQRHVVSKRGDVLLLSMLVFLTCGFCEVTSLIVLWSHVFLLVVFYNRKNWRWFMPILMSGCLGFLLMVSAPGNAERAAYFSDNHDLMYSFWMSSLQTARFLLTWLANPVFVLSLLSLIFFHKSYQNKYTRALKIPIWQGLAILILIMFSCTFPAYWGTGILGQHRTLNVAYFFTIIWSVLMIISIMNTHQTKLGKIEKSPIKKWFFSLMLLSVIIAPNFRNAIFDWFSGDLAEFDDQMHQRMELIEACPKNCELEPITTRPKSIFLYDISDDPHNFVNEGWACFYGKNAVFLKK